MEISPLYVAEKFYEHNRHYAEKYFGEGAREILSRSHAPGGATLWKEIL